MTPSERTTHVAALLRGVDSVRLCWAPSSKGGELMCGGTVTWTDVDGRPRSSCSRCNATGTLTTPGTRDEIRRLFGRSAEECQESEP